METLIDLVRNSGERFGRLPALIIRPSFRTRTMTHGDLADAVPRVARVLSDKGLEVGDRAIIWAVNRPEWGLAFLAVVHAGGVAVPLDVRHTVDFGRRIVDQTTPKLVLASRQTKASARALGLPIVWIESLPDLARRSEPLPAARTEAGTLAEIVFTSGTTGEPKGAMLSHGNLMSCATAMSEVMSITPDDRLLSVLPLSHLYEQVLGFVGPLLVGASIVYPVSRQPAVLIKAGAGLIAVDGGAPIVPVKIHIHEMSWIDRRRWPSPLRGDVELVVGDPIWFDADTDHATATTRLEAAVAAL